MNHNLLHYKNQLFALKIFCFKIHSVFIDLCSSKFFIKLGNSPTRSNPLSKTIYFNYLVFSSIILE